MENLKTYAGKTLTFIGEDSRMLTGNKYKILRDVISYDADGKEYFEDYEPKKPEFSRELRVSDERNHYRDFGVSFFKTD